MEFRVCPDCEKAFYASRDAAHVACQHCGYVLMDRRVKERTACNIDFTFLYNGKTVNALLKDFSETGLKIVYKGHSLKVDSVLDVNVEQLEIHRAIQAVWTKKLSRVQYSSGVRFIRQGSQKK